MDNGEFTVSEKQLEKWDRYEQGDSMDFQSSGLEDVKIIKVQQQW